MIEAFDSEVISSFKGKKLIDRVEGVSNAGYTLGKVPPYYKYLCHNKMKNLRRVLLWEILRYEPIILFTLDSLNRQFQEVLRKDVSYIHYFLESAMD